VASLFTRRATTRLRLAIVLAIAAMLGVPLFLMGWVRTPLERGEFQRISQPIPFSHQIHVRGLRIDCRYCHYTVERAATAGMPSTPTCVPGHKQVWLDSPWFAPVRQSLSSGTPIQWNRVNQLPGFVYFDHSIHVNKGVGCEECHGRVDSMTTAVQVEPLTMGWCLDCHRSPAEHLRPVAQMTAMGWTPPAGQSRAALGRELVERYHVRRPTDCTDCHR
jgi:hypothetical protein